MVLKKGDFYYNGLSYSSVSSTNQIALLILLLIIVLELNFD
ncbi:hypothetical protein [Listeria immobilis]|nr:hypothetical protein [Listeria immobilis]